MVMCSFSSTLYPFIPYGCYCGFGGYGTPMDEIDKCCQTHDNCYGDALAKCYNITSLLYLWPYSWSCPKTAEGAVQTKTGNSPICKNSYRNPCGQALCECDQKIVECWANVSTTPPSERLECIEPKSNDKVDLSAYRRKALDAMNKFRAQLVSGNIATASGKLPRGREIWNDTLEDLAKKKVDECNFKLTQTNSQNNGEATHVSFDIKDEPIEDAISEWTKRVEQFYNSTSVSTSRIGSLDDFVQIASGLTVQVGCATNDICQVDYSSMQDYGTYYDNYDDYKTDERPTVQYTVCKFWPSGFMFKKLYKKGKQCKVGWPCRRRNSVCNKDGLCETEKTEKCDGENVPLKKSALDAMNKFRIQLAAGKIPAKNGKFPMGKEIYKLKWNCTLQALAEQKVQECDYSPAYTDSQGIGEAQHVPYDPPKYAVKEGLKEWMKRLKGKRNVTLLTSDYTSLLDDFVQVASGSTTDVGCATNSKCTYDYGDGDVEKIHYTVCKFWPSAKTFPILYEEGEQCELGWPCALPNSVCNKNKLCVRTE
ncbi:unnamed protein product [Dracunculus medinensis]|uniref:Phospholipase A(2) n=1 Tax=Dracunculus medinensis TaxID=318479 RepID=A0A0N4URG7_DRAME|nr:unnamed protein product [Dracunculus medinensis]